MNNVINLQQYKYKKQMESFNASVYNFFTTIFDFFLTYVAYPIVAAIATVRKRQLVVI